MPVERIKGLFSAEEKPQEEIVATLNEMNFFEIARLLHELTVEEKIKVFHALDSDEKRQTLLYETDRDSRHEIQDSLDKEYLAFLLDEMPVDEAADLLKEYEEEVQEELLDKMGKKDADVIKNLITYGEETAGGLMTPLFYRVSPTQTATDILVQLKRESNHEMPPYFYVIKSNGELAGFFKLRDLLNVPAFAPATSFVREHTPTVLLDDTCDKIANLMDNEHLSAIPVVNEDNIMQGVVTFDDVIRAMQDIASVDIFTMVGTAKIDPFAKRTINKITTRAPWLFITFIGGMLSASILGFFESQISEFATILFFIPFVIGLAGNVGIQGATVIVRGMATGDVQDDNLRTVVRSEVLVGAANGVIFGLVCGVFIAMVARPLLNTTPVLGLVVGTGIMLAVIVASLVGSLAPTIFMKFGIDPAISAGPFVTVANDIMGIFIYLMTAKLILGFV
ncbi:MAG: magnesium transporter [Candidatus Nitrohelix vancouverensis]|uniref:Magnesium transporter MgtE n=1 Tax=Candidatus Nitrohelix vancouverensis TaxID=2705534 RepID=A0A7T0C3T0_9BACT|nr:MAG: magnesium transporter [Candidatus Nitrohelix vancouverensis]